MKDHRTSSFQSSKVKVGTVSHICMSKTSISSRIQNFWKGPLRIFPSDGQIQGEVVVGTTYPAVLEERKTWSNNL